MESHTPARSVSVADFANGVYVLRSGDLVRVFWVEH